MDSKKLQKRHLEILVRNKGFQFTDTFFPYTSGKIGPYYIQSTVVMRNGKDYDETIEDMSEMVFNVMNKANIRDYVVSGGESRDWIFAFPIAINLGRPHTMIYKDGKVLGADMNNRSIAHVADLNNEGSSVRDLWIPTIKREGGKIKDVFFYIDRMERGFEVIRDLNLRSHSLVQLDKNAWEYLQKKGVVSKKAYENLMERIENKEGWARRMLRSEEGFKTLFNLAKGDKKDREKVEKILSVGYPEIGDEIIEGLKTRGMVQD